MVGFGAKAVESNCVGTGTGGAEAGVGETSTLLDAAGDGVIGTNYKS